MPYPFRLFLATLVGELRESISEDRLGQVAQTFAWTSQFLVILKLLEANGGIRREDAESQKNGEQIGHWLVITSACVHQISSQKDHVPELMGCDCHERQRISQ